MMPDGDDDDVLFFTRLKYTLSIDFFFQSA